MTVKDIFSLAIKMGIHSDFRPKSQIDKQLKRLKEKYNKLPKDEQELFDRELLENPYPDSRIHVDSGAKQVRRVMAGIDLEGSELMIARYLSNHNPNNPIDLAIAHHPVGKALADLGEAMHLQIDVLAQHGIPVNITEQLMMERIGELNRGISPLNHYQPVDAARLLNMDYINVHAPADNLMGRFVEAKVKKEKPEYVGDILKLLLAIPEYREAARQGAGPRLFVGSNDSRAGKIICTEVTGGTSGSKRMYEKMAHAGVGTIIGMHMSEDHKKEAEKHHLNVVIAGHISSDSLGMNLFLDELEKKGIEIVPCGGLIRHSRVKK